MADKNKTDGELLDHDYDGIQEYNNPLPNWWLMTFFGTIIFAAVYYFHYQIQGGTTLAEEFKEAMKELPAQTAPAAAPTGETEESLAAIMSKPEVLAKGKEVFAARCLACHGDAGQGLVGPNLTDKFWIHGQGTRTDILAVVRKGVPDKGMLAWETILPPEEVIAVVAHVYTLKGTNPPQPKAPQGVEVQ